MTAGMPPKVTRIGSSKPPPLIVTVSPPCGLPVLGLTEERKKVSGTPGSPMTTFAKPTPVETVARRLAVPSVAPGKRTTVAWPFTSSNVSSCGPAALPSDPRVVVSVPRVRLATGAPLSARMARMVRVEKSVLPASSAEGDAEMVTLTPTEGGIGTDGGAVGELGSSALHARVNASPRARSGKRNRVKALIVTLSWRIRALLRA